MSHAARPAEKKICDNPLCVGMAIVTAAVATGLVLYSSAAILLMLR